MDYRNYGRTGLTVSRLGYGAMRYPYADGKVDMEAACKVLRHAYESGINFFDSQHYYCEGLSETAIGEALSDVRDKIVIQTKCPYYSPETPGNTYMDRLKIALKKLKTDYIDVLLVHSVAPQPWDTQEKPFKKFARTALRNGLVRHIGFSSHAPLDFVLPLIESGDYDVVLFPYNLVETTYAPALARARQLGLGTSTMNPVGGGRLAPPNPELLAMIDRPVTGTVELAMRFALANDDIDVVVSGMTYPEWVTENARIVDKRPYLIEDDMQSIRKVMAEKEELAKLYCTGCRYCLPCPQGVDIPQNFHLLNMYRLYGLKDWAKQSYANMKEKKEQDNDSVRASACTACGQCEPKCPNKIPIIEQLKEVDRLLGS